jgi:hypothetical protein
LVIALVYLKPLHISDIHSTILKKHDTKVDPQIARRDAGDLRKLAADKGYDAKIFCKKTR